MRNDCRLSDGWINAQAKSREYSKNAKNARISEYMKSPSRCKHCSTIIPYAKRNNLFCNRSCAASYNNRGVVRNGISPKSTQCELCGYEFVPTRGSTGKFCSLKCSEEKARQVSISRLMNGEVKSLTKFQRLHIISIRGSTCEECGLSPIHPVTGRSTLTIDHIDGKSINNRMDNLKVLCPTCHSLTPTYGILNKGNCTRDYRYKTR